MARCGARLMATESRAFGTTRWGEDGLATLTSSHGHAYLGYLALGLGMLRAMNPQHPTAAVHDALIAALARRLDAAPAGLIETYPGEAYPPDVASVVGAIGLAVNVAAFVMLREGASESLNVAMAATLLCFEVARRRNGDRS